MIWHSFWNKRTLIKAQNESSEIYIYTILRFNYNFWKITSNISQSIHFRPKSWTFKSSKNASQISLASLLFLVWQSPAIIPWYIHDLAHSAMSSTRHMHMYDSNYYKNKTYQFFNVSHNIVTKCIMYKHRQIEITRY